VRPSQYLHAQATFSAAEVGKRMFPTAETAIAAMSS